MNDFAAEGVAAGVYRLWLTESEQAAAVSAGAEQCPAPCDSLEDLAWLFDTRSLRPEATVFGPALWGQPRTYAHFLGQELAFLYKGPLLIVMPSGLGFNHGRQPTTREYAVLKNVPNEVTSFLIAVRIHTRMTIVVGS